MNKTLVLTGMMGVGKSTIGKSLAKKLSYNFKDIDNIIERKEGCSINQIFNLTHGHGRSIKELIGILKDSFPDIVIENKERDKLMPERGTLSIEKAKKLINYKPSWKLENGYKEYINWYKKIFEVQKLN